MSLKRLGVIAAVSHFNGQLNHNSTMMMTTTTTRTATTIPTATTMSFAANTAYNQNSGGSNPQQFGGLGLLHQQNLRSGANAAIGGFTVGGIGGGAPIMGGGSSSPGGSHNINGNVNVLLGGAMLSVVTTVLCVVCYCCHRNIKKRTEAAYRQRWMDNDANMEIYSVEQCYETSGLFMESSEGLAVPALSHEPPPSYDAVVAMQEESQVAARISPPPDYRSMNNVSGSSNANEIPKFIRGTNLLGMKKVLSAQSCCSLQRAEAENLYQLGVAAAAAAAVTSGHFGVSALGRKSLPYSSRDSAASGEGRFVSQPYYRGCPLCGKFRYDDSMSLSSDSGLDQVVVAVDVNNRNAAVGVDKDACYCTPLQSPTVDDSNNNVSNNNNNNNDDDDADHEHHSGSVSQPTDDRRCILEMSSSSHEVDVAKCEDTINNNNGCGDDTPTAGTSPVEYTSASSSSTATAIAASTNTSSSGDTTDVTLDLDSINDNGIIRLDMSKIIDKTGLPTYEAALKLESSGYV